jgi:hypothetical protein
MRDTALTRYENLLTRTQVEELSKSIATGEQWLVDSLGKVSPAKLDKGRARLKELKEQRARVIYNNELPFVVLDAVADLLQRSTVLGAAGPESGMHPYIRVVIPGIVTFEADIALPDVPF